MKPVNIISTDFVQGLVDQAASLPRLRTNHNYHKPHDFVQRMINAVVPGSYVTPHKHESPDKVELLYIMQGKAAFFVFSEFGDVEEMHILDAEGAVRGVDIPAKTYHCFVALTPCAILEIIQGPYNPDTHKKFAPWAPKEGSPECAAFLASLEARANGLLSE